MVQPDRASTHVGLARSVWAEGDCEHGQAMGPQGAKGGKSQTETGFKCQLYHFCGMWSHQPSLKLCFFICNKE